VECFLGCSTRVKRKAVAAHLANCDAFEVMLPFTMQYYSARELRCVGGVHLDSSYKIAEDEAMVQVADRDMGNVSMLLPMLRQALGMGDMQGQNVVVLKRSQLSRHERVRCPECNANVKMGYLDDHLAAMCPVRRHALLAHIRECRERDPTDAKSTNAKPREVQRMRISLSQVQRRLARLRSPRRRRRG